jgi:hypothetical protein
MTESDPPLAEIVRGQFESDAIAGQNTDEIFFHAACRVSNEIVAVFQFDAEAAVGEDVLHNALHFDEFFFCHDLDLRYEVDLSSLLAEV